MNVAFNGLLLSEDKFFLLLASLVPALVFHWLDICEILL